MPLSSVVGAQSIIKPGVCTSSTRPAVPFEGQVIFETDTDRLYVYNGTAWVIPNAPLQNPQGLELIKTVTCSSGGTASGGVVTVGTTVSAVVMDNAFSATYDNYLIVDSGGTSSVDAPYRLTFGSSVAGYYYAMIYGSFLGGAVNLDAGNNFPYFNYAGGSGTRNGFIEVNNPFLATNTELRSRVRYSTVYGTNVGIHGVSSSFTGFTLTASTGTLTGGTIRVYGYRNS